MISNLIQHELPVIVYDNADHIIKCVVSNTPIKRSIRKEIYKWIADECIEYKYQSKYVFICIIIKAICLTISNDKFIDNIHQFDLNDKEQKAFPELNVNKVEYWAKKNKLCEHNTHFSTAWFDGFDYDARIAVLKHCIDTINKNIEREKRVASSTGEQH